jgi:hypothetical protein
VYDGGEWDRVAAGAITLNNDKYSVTRNPSTGQYNRLHILNVRGSDVTKYRCSGAVNGQNKEFYLQLDLLGKYNYIFVIFCCWQENK